MQSKYGGCTIFLVDEIDNKEASMNEPKSSIYNLNIYKSWVFKIWAQMQWRIKIKIKIE